MNENVMRYRNTMIAAGAAAVGAALIARSLRAARSIDFHGRSVVITGGSRGLGLLIARELGQLGARVTIAARDAAELERAKADLEGRGIDVLIAQADIRERQAAERLIADVLERRGAIDVLINNAGVIQVGPVAHMLRGDFEDALAVHFWGPLHTMRAAIPHMQHAGGGRIVNISSIGGKIGVPHLAPYCASKFALAGLSESMRAELARDRIYVTAVYPGLMRTGSPFNAWFRGRYREEFAWFATSDSLPIATIAATRAAAQIVEACRHGDAELIISWPAKLAVLAKSIAPEAAAIALQIANRLLPAPSDSGSGDARHSGWQSFSDWAPSRLTKSTERAAAENNELPE